MKKISLMILAFALVLGAIVTALPTAKAQAGPVQFYFKDAADGDNIYAGKSPSPFPTVITDLYISSPHEWMGTPLGIVAYQVSIRVDPRVLGVYDIIVAPDVDGDGLSTDGILELYAAYLVMMGIDPDATTIAAAEGKDIPSGTLYAFADSLTNIEPTEVGGAGGHAFYGFDSYPEKEAMLCQIKFQSKSATLPTVLDLMGPDQIVKGIKASCMYATADGSTYEVPEIDVEDGYYVAETPDTMYFDSSEGYDPLASPMYTDWHELWPTFCQWWSLESWDDGTADGKLSASDQIDMVQTSGGALGLIIYGHADWVNPAPVGGDGLTDLIITLKEEAEFPLGIGLLMAMVPMIAVVYVWRLRKRSR